VRIHLITCFLLAFLINTNAQENTIKWGGEYEDRGYYSIIGEAENAFFVERKYNTRFNNRAADIELIRFNHIREITHAVEIRDLEKDSYQSIATINSPEGLAHIYYQTTKSGRHIVSAQLFDHASLRKTEIVDLANFKIYNGARENVQEDLDFQLTYPLDIILSRDRSKLAVMYEQERVGKSDLTFYQYIVIDLENRFSIVQQGSFFSENESNKYQVIDRHLSNSGRLTYAIKRYIKNISTEHINRRPAYDYEIHHMSGDSLEYIYDINVKKEYIDRLKIGSDDSDNLYIVGYLREKPFGEIYKTYMFSLDPIGYERYKSIEKLSRRDIEDITGRERDELDENFETLEVIPTDNIVYVIRQYRRRGQTNRNINNGMFFNNGFNQFNNTIFHWEYDQVVIDGHGTQTGERMWTTVNPREQEDDNEYSRYFITGQYEIVDNMLVFIYNERQENIIKVRRNEDIKRTDIPGDRTMITMARVSSLGDIRYMAIGEEDDFHLPEKGVFVGDEKVYFFYQHRNMKNFFTGIASKEILEF